MDPETISILAAGALTALKPYLSAISTKAAEKIGSELPAAVGKLWGTLKSKFDTKEAAREALDDLLKNPDNEAFQTVFKVQLEKLMSQDERFAGQVQELVQEAGVSVQVGDGAAAIGDHARAVGKDAILIEGSVGGDVLGAGATKTGEK